jgi:hypothetical protein
VWLRRPIGYAQHPSASDMVSPIAKRWARPDPDENRLSRHGQLQAGGSGLQAGLANEARHILSCPVCVLRMGAYHAECWHQW